MAYKWQFDFNMNVFKISTKFSLNFLITSLSKLDRLRRCLLGISLDVQWLRICLPMQGTWVWSLVGELRAHMLQDSKAYAGSYWDPEAMLHNKKPVSHKKRNPTHRNRDPAHWKTDPAHHNTDPAHHNTDPAHRETDPAHQNTVPKQTQYTSRQTQHTSRQTQHTARQTPHTAI